VARQFIYHMAGLNKSYGQKKILENIHLSFYPDAKIGILGPNGAGKSTVLRIMAGLDKEFTGEAWLAEGATSGYLPQEPQLDPSKDVLGNVMEGVAAKKAILDRYNELMMDYSDETAEEAAKLQDEIDSKNLWDLDSQVEMAMEALRCPPGDADVTKLSGGERDAWRSASCCCGSPTCCSSTSPPTISMPRRPPGLKSICANIRAPC
jgi:ATPase subunit of ABC transporter with duplicated ATPase domains